MHVKDNTRNFITVAVIEDTLAEVRGKGLNLLGGE